MKFEDEIKKSRGLFRAKRVYGDPVERDGVTVIPAASIVGGGGGGGSHDGNGNEGGGTGFGLIGRPVGAWVVRDGQAQWKPSYDVNVAVIAAQFVLFGFFLWLMRRRRD